MDYSTCIVGILTPLVLSDCGEGQKKSAPLAQAFSAIFETVLESVSQLGHDFLSQPVDAERTFAFEQQLQERLREAGRQIVQAVYNRVEPTVKSLPKHVHFEAGQYTRLNRKTPQNVWTLFGQIRLHRVGYRPTDKTGDATSFPVALDPTRLNCQNLKVGRGYWQG